MTESTLEPEAGPAPGRRSRRGASWRWVPVFALAATVLVAGCSSSTKVTDPGPKLVEFGKVEVTGHKLPSMPDSGADSAIGKQAPTVVGQRFDGSSISMATDGKPTVIFFLAHWCPHCNREVPALVDDWQANGAPVGVNLLSVTTGSNENAPNWPPSTWVKNEHWTVPVLADDADGTAANAYGLTGYPFIVMLKPDGTVFYRNAGEWPVADFNAKVQQLVQASR